MNKLNISESANIDPDTGIDKDVLSTHHSRESLAALKYCKDTGKFLEERLVNKLSTENDIDSGFSTYTKSISKYLISHADNEFSSQQGDRFIEKHGDALRARAKEMQRMSERFSEGNLGVDEIQFLYTEKVDMEARGKDISRLLAYIDQKKQKLVS